MPALIHHPEVWLFTLLFFAAAWLILHSGLTLAYFGQNLGTYPRTLIVSAVLVALVAVFVLINKLQRKKTSPEKIAKAVEGARKLFPVKGSERILWIAVSLTAGFCEEFLYRGWLLNLTGATVKSVWLGLLISSFFFSFAHLYQGRNGIISTGILGAVFGLIYLGSGSLLPGQIIHALLDVNNGLAFGRVAARTQAVSPP